MTTQSNPFDNAADDIDFIAMVALEKLRHLFTAVQDADDLDQAKGLAIIGLEIADDSHNYIDALSEAKGKEVKQ